VVLLGQHLRDVLARRALRLAGRWVAGTSPAPSVAKSL
jgi:hypothetical protein